MAPREIPAEESADENPVAPEFDPLPPPLVTPLPLAKAKEEPVDPPTPAAPAPVGIPRAFSTIPRAAGEERIEDDEIPILGDVLPTREAGGGC